MARTAKNQGKPQVRAIKEVPRRELYPTSEASKLLCCSDNFLRAEIKAGNIGYIIRNNRSLIPAFAIDEYLRKRYVEPKAQIT